MNLFFKGAVALFVCAGLFCSCASTKSQPVQQIQSAEELQELFSLTIQTGGRTASDLYALGKKYEAGDGVVQWYSMARAYYEAAAEKGSEESRTALSRLSDFKAEVLSKSPNGQGEVFTFYRKGVSAGQAGDFEKAWAICYDTAFFFDDSKGLESLADFLRDGSGVEQDVQKAMAVYTYTATVLKAGNGWASLGKIYEAENGTYPGITQSIDTALDYFMRSFTDDSLRSKAFKGPRYVADYLDSGYTHDDGSRAAPDYAQAEKYYLLAADGNGRTFDGTSCYKLGTYYEEGREGVAQDFSKAAQYYAKAVSDPNTHATMLGIPQSYYSLGRFYENGLGVEKNLAQAKAWYEKALSAANETLGYEFAAGRAEAAVTKKQAEEALGRL